MKKPVASSKANSSIVMVMKDGKSIYHVRNRLMTQEIEITAWDLARRRYRRAIRIFRESIDEILRQKYSPIPVYRDSYVTDIMLVIRNHKGENDLALEIFNLISSKDGSKEKSSC